MKLRAIPTFLLIFVFSIFFHSFANASDKLDQQAELSRLQQAFAKTNIFELAAFTLKANIQVEIREKLIDGNYQLLWNGPDQWREEISLPGPGYHEIQIGGKGVIWVQRNTDFIPVGIFNLHRALGFGSSAGTPPAVSLVQIGLTPKDTITKKREKKEFGEKATCLDIQYDLGYTSALCIRDDSGVILRETSYESEKDLQPFGSKTFPRELTFKLEDRTMAKAIITELTNTTQFPPGAFAVPASVSPQPGCMNPQVARLSKKEAPHYPEDARSRRVQGTVSIQTTIGIDGVPQIGKVVESSSKELEWSSIEAIQHWRYNPAQCDGKPVATNTILQVNYKLSP